MSGPHTTQPYIKCDAPGCEERFELPQGDALGLIGAAERAYEAGWGVNEHSSGLYHFCPAHKAAYRDKTPRGRTLMGGGSWR